MLQHLAEDLLEDIWFLAEKMGNFEEKALLRKKEVGAPIMSPAEYKVAVSVSKAAETNYHGLGGWIYRNILSQF